MYQRWKAVDAEARDKAKKAQEAADYAQHDIDRYTKQVERKDMGQSSIDYYKEQLEEAKKTKKEAEEEAKEARKAMRALDPVELVQDEWQKQFEAAPSTKTEHHHLIGGAVMRFWNPIREASGRRMDVFSAVDAKSGDRVVGIEIPANQINNLIARIAGGKSTVSAEQIVRDDVFKNATQYELEGGIKIRRGRVGGENVVQLVTGNADVQTTLKNMGVIYERGMQPIYYLPGDRYSTKAVTVLEKVLEQYPAKVAGGEEAPKPAENPLSGRDAKLPNRPDLGSTTYAGGFLDPELFKTLFPSVAEAFKQWVTDAHTPGDEQRAMMRETRGERDRLIARVAKKMEPMRKSWIFRSRDDSRAFFNAVEEGRLQDLPEKDRALAQAFKSALDKMKDDLQDLKPEILQQYIENYFPHIWKHPSLAGSTIRAVMQGRRPFAGKGSFLKQRTIPTIQDGLDMGLTPVSWNPVDLFLQKYSEMSQFLMAHKTLAMMKDAGTTKLVRVGQKAPDGWRQLEPDKIGTVYGRETTIDPQKVEDATYDKSYMGGKRPIPSVAREDLDEAMREGMVIRGHYYAPARTAAKVFNNYVSRGLSGRSGILRRAALDEQQPQLAPSRYLGLPRFDHGDQRGNV